MDRLFLSSKREPGGPTCLYTVERETRPMASRLASLREEEKTEPQFKRIKRIKDIEMEEASC